MSDCGSLCVFIVLTKLPGGSGEWSSADTRTRITQCIVVYSIAFGTNHRILAEKSVVHSYDELICVRVEGNGVPVPVDSLRE